MKKILNSFIFVIFAALAFNACSDVPAPYDTPTVRKLMKLRRILAMPLIIFLMMAQRTGNC